MRTDDSRFISAAESHIALIDSTTTRQSHYTANDAAIHRQIANLEDLQAVNPAPKRAALG
jgi:hypothetical protein